LRRLRLGHPQETCDATLAWSQTITVFPDGLGRNVMTTGVFDPALTEIVHRLLDPGGLAVDIGANVGYFTNLMSARTGPTGAVMAFEPHPVVFDVLRRNAARWHRDPGVAAVMARRLAISAESGEGRLTANTNMEQMGVASLRASSEPAAADDFTVATERLDELLRGQSVRLLKIDVEGHEHAVLTGAQELLGERRIRDVVFEDFETYPTPAMTLLERHGMTVFTIDRSLRGPRVHPVSEGPAPRQWPGRNYLATFNPGRAIDRLRSRGWRSFR